jgi:hypothetical protein
MRLTFNQDYLLDETAFVVKKIHFKSIPFTCWKEKKS